MDNNGFCIHGNHVAMGDLCGACEDGRCVHGRKVHGYQWEAVEGCIPCGKPAREPNAQRPASRGVWQADFAA